GSSPSSASSRSTLASRRRHARAAEGGLFSSRLTMGILQLGHGAPRMPFDAHARAPHFGVGQPRGLDLIASRVDAREEEADDRALGLALVEDVGELLEEVARDLARLGVFGERSRDSGIARRVGCSVEAQALEERRVLGAMMANQTHDDFSQMIED